MPYRLILLAAQFLLIKSLLVLSHVHAHPLVQIVLAVQILQRMHEF